MATLLVLNGPNLNMALAREGNVYGTSSLEDIEDICVRQAGSIGASLVFFQSNHQGDLIDQIYGAKGRFDGILINAGSLAHTSIGIMDALLSVDIPAIDIHLSNIHSLEEFRHTSYVAKAAVGCISGFGPGSYLLAIDAMMMHLDSLGNTSQDDDGDISEPLAVGQAERVDEPPLPTAKARTSDAIDMSPDANGLDASADVAKYAAAAAAEITAKARSSFTQKPEDDEEPSPNSNPAFNEMFDTPPKEVLDSLGISAPELRPVPKSDEKPLRKSVKEEVSKAAESSSKRQAQVRSFRKLS